jgi:hypothetical protein
VYNTRAAANTGSDDEEESGDEEVVMVTPSDSDDDDVPWHSSSRCDNPRRTFYSKAILRNPTLPSAFKNSISHLV